MRLSNSDQTFEQPDCGARSCLAVSASLTLVVSRQHSLQQKDRTVNRNSSLHASVRLTARKRVDVSRLPWSAVDMLLSFVNLTDLGLKAEYHFRALLLHPGDVLLQLLNVPGSASQGCCCVVRLRLSTLRCLMPIVCTVCHTIAVSRCLVTLAAAVTAGADGAYTLTQNESAHNLVPGLHHRHIWNSSLCHDLEVTLRLKHAVKRVQGDD